MIVGHGLRVLIVALLLSAVAPAHAQWVPPEPLSSEEQASLERDFDETFQKILEDPGDLDLAFHYAVVATKLGNFEAAISALDRMLLFNPNLPRVRLELGVLYFRLGSYTMAQSYFDRAVEGGEVPEEVRMRVAAFTKEIDKRLSSSQFGGSVTVGGRYQSNANAGPSSALVKVFGLDATLDDRFTEKGDGSAFAAVSLRHTLDFQTQNGAFLESGLNIYAAEQGEQTQLNLLFAEATIGPRFKLPNDGSFRPYGLVNIVTLDRDLYFRTLGGGLEVTQRLGERLKGEINVAVKSRNYNNTVGRPLSSQRDSTDIEATGNLQYLAGGDTILSLGGSFRDIDADTDTNSYREWAATLGAVHGFDGPNGRGWLASLTGARVWSNYEDIDPTIDPIIRRRDKEWRIDFSLNIPVTDRIAVIATLGHLDVDSSLANFAYNNTYGTFALTLGF